MINLEFDAIEKSYDTGLPVIRDLSLDIKRNEFCVIVGPSGCGKSTLLRLVAGLEDITGGELRLDGKRINELPPGKRDVAMVFQSYALFPHMTVYDNIAFGLRLLKTQTAVLDAKVRAAAQTLQLSELLQRHPRDLSGGQRQRVAIARAIVREPSLFLFDEPLSNLDAALRVKTRFELAKLHRQFEQAATLYVTHDQVEAMTLADKIVLLHTGADIQTYGSVAQVGAPLDLYHRPASRFVASFIGSPGMNFLPARLEQQNGEQWTVRLDTGELLALAAHKLSPTHASSNHASPNHTPQVGQFLTLGIRPEHVYLSAQESRTGDQLCLTRELSWQERLGDSSSLYFEHQNDLLIVKTHSTVSVGQRLPLYLDGLHLHVFDRAGRCISNG